VSSATRPAAPAGLDAAASATSVCYDVGMFRHVVMFQWDASVEAAQVAGVAAGFDALPALIPEIRSYEHGADVGLSPTNFDYVLVADFDDEADFAVYRDHPDHRAFIDRHIVGAAARRCAIQYEIA
jgi:Stress responsive A/B Barrel Domain